MDWASEAGGWEICASTGSCGLWPPATEGSLSECLGDGLAPREAAGTGQSYSQENSRIDLNGVVENGKDVLKGCGGCGAKCFGAYFESSATCATAWNVIPSKSLIIASNPSCGCL